MTIAVRIENTETQNFGESLRVTVEGSLGLVHYTVLLPGESTTISVGSSHNITLSEEK